MQVIVWSKDGCSYCENAKALLESRNIQFEERKIGYGWDKDALLAAVPNARTVPQIIINGEAIGGYTELSALLG
jgi:glutaredoxin 3